MPCVVKKRPRLPHLRHCRVPRLDRATHGVLDRAVRRLHGLGHQLSRPPAGPLHLVVHRLSLLILGPLREPHLVQLKLHLRDKRYTVSFNTSPSSLDDSHEAVSRRPPLSLYSTLARTHMYTRGARVWDWSLVQGPFSVAPCPTHTATIRNFLHRCTTRRRIPAGAKQADPERLAHLVDFQQDGWRACRRGRGRRPGLWRNGAALQRRQVGSGGNRERAAANRRWSTRDGTGER
jgi:hypothetical protein